MSEETALAHADAQNNNLDLLIARVKGLKRRRMLRTLLLPGAMGFLIVFTLICLYQVNPYLDTVWQVVTPILVCSPIAIAWIIAERREKRAVDALAATHQLRALGALLDTVNGSGGHIQNSVHAALLELLPQLTAEHATLLGTTQREVLNGLLYGKSGELALAALGATEQVGDGTALPYLTSIAAGKGVPSTLKNRTPEVQQRAQNTVDAIRERIENQNRAGGLLRAAQAPGTTPGQLVRPAYKTVVDDGSELLRAQTLENEDLKEDKQ